MPNVDKRLGVLEARMDDHARRIRIQEEKNERLSELSAYVKLQYEHNKKTDKRFEQMTKVLDGINTNLLSLNHDVKSMKEKQEDMENKVGGLEREQSEALKSFKKNTLDNRTKIIIGVVTGVTTSIIGAFLLLWLRLK